MAITKTYEDGTMDFNNGTPDILGGGLASGGLGAIIAGAIAAGMAGVKGGSSSGLNVGGGSSSELVAPGILNPGTGTMPGTEGATAPTEPPKNEEEKKEEDKQIIPPIPGENEIKDETDKNTETPINSVDMMSWLEEQQKKQWEREDTIRKETQAREDNAYQRAVEDMRKAGINPNLMNVQAAASGGGITNATGLESGIYSAETNKIVTLIEQEIENAFKEDENAKDRITDLIGGLVKTIIAGLMLK